MSIGERWAQPNLLAGYHLEGVNDFSGNGNTLTNIGTVTFTMGRFGNAANFGNPNTTKELYCHTDLGVSLPASNWSMECMVNFAAAPGTSAYALILAWYSQTGTKGMAELYYHNSAGTLKLEVWTINTEPSISVNKTLIIGKFYHIVVTQTSGGTISLYLDGVLIGTGTHITHNPETSYIQVALIDYPLSGLIDEAAFFSRTLSAIEIRRWFAWSKGLLV